MFFMFLKNVKVMLALSITAVFVGTVIRSCIILFSWLHVARYTERTVLQSYEMSGLVVQFHQIEQRLYKMSTCQFISFMT